MINNESNSNNLIQQYMYYYSLDRGHVKNKVILQQIHTKLNNEHVQYIGSFIKIIDIYGDKQGQGQRQGQGQGRKHSHGIKYRYGYITGESLNCWEITSIIINKTGQTGSSDGPDGQDGHTDILNNYTNCLEIPITMSHIQTFTNTTPKPNTNTNTNNTPIITLSNDTINAPNYFMELVTNRVIKQHVQIGLILPYISMLEQVSQPTDTSNSTSSNNSAVELLCVISGQDFNPYCTNIR